MVVRDMTGIVEASDVSMEQKARGEKSTENQTRQTKSLRRDEQKEEEKAIQNLRRDHLRSSASSVTKPSLLSNSLSGVMPLPRCEVEDEVANECG